jgi:hypothetical protein
MPRNSDRKFILPRPGADVKIGVALTPRERGPDLSPVPNESPEVGANIPTTKCDACRARSNRALRIIPDCGQDATLTRPASSRATKGPARGCFVMCKTVRHDWSGQLPPTSCRDVRPSQQSPRRLAVVRRAAASATRSGPSSFVNSVLGHWRKRGGLTGMSALTPKADIDRRHSNVRFVPMADISQR